MLRYWVYVMTNYLRSVLYIGMTNDLAYRVTQHASLADPACFTARYQCVYLLYFEEFVSRSDAIRREKELKGWSRQKKMALISETNPDLVFLNNTPPAASP